MERWRLPENETTSKNHRRQGGQGLMEYALLIVLIAIVVMAVLILLGPAVGNLFSNVIQNI
jgi:pilus assembly protein Flp/PilA